MKSMKKLLALALVLVMMTGLAISASAATITIETPTTQVAPTETSTYKVYKVFDATVNATDSTKVNYTLCAGDTLSSAMTAAGFSVDTAGNVSFTGTMPTDGSADDTVIKAIAGYVTDADLVATVEIPAGTASKATENLAPGYYYVTTSTGSAVMIKTNNAAETVTIKDKNVIPPVVKSAGTAYDAASLKAIAAVGTDQPFTAQITKTHGATNLVFTDTMTNMTYNGDVVITVSAGTAPTAAQAVVTLTETGFKVTFDNAYIAGLADGTIITLKYSGKITSDALSVNPAKNKATLTSGDGNKSESEEVEVYNAKFTVTKQDGDKKALAGAGFVIKNSDGAYYKFNPGVAASGDTAATPPTVTWYALADGETLEAAIAADKITEYKSDATGAVPAFTGLGTGSYILVESTTPPGYNTAADYSFTIADKDYTTTNLEQVTTVVNNAGTELPSTGGIGTTLFYVFGTLLVLGAGVVLVAKRRVQE